MNHKHTQKNTQFPLKVQMSVNYVARRISEQISPVESAVKPFSVVEE
jgi:hypothetical protein